MLAAKVRQWGSSFLVFFLSLWSAIYLVRVMSMEILAGLGQRDRKTYCSTIFWERFSVHKQSISQRIVARRIELLMRLFYIRLLCFHSSYWLVSKKRRWRKAKEPPPLQIRMPSLGWDRPCTASIRGVPTFSRIWKKLNRFDLVQYGSESVVHTNLFSFHFQGLLDFGR